MLLFWRQITPYNSIDTVEVLCDRVDIELIDVTDPNHVAALVPTACDPATVCALGCRHDILAVVPGAANRDKESAVAECLRHSSDLACGTIHVCITTTYQLGGLSDGGRTLHVRTIRDRVGSRDHVGSRYQSDARNAGDEGSMTPNAAVERPRDQPSSAPRVPNEMTHMRRARD